MQQQGAKFISSKQFYEVIEAKKSNSWINFFGYILLYNLHYYSTTMNNHLLYTPQDFFAEARDEAEVDNLLNTDVYKLLMLDFVLAHPEYQNIPVKRDMTIRSKGLQTANIIPLAALSKQLEATKQVSGISPADASYLRGMTTNNGKALFQEETLNYLQNLQLPEYQIGKDANNNYTLSFT
ncbi:MAG: hypothetical protein H6765_08135 [Candidatus Peribacteria bacterium]|nr:MAG: hypothetical protein H6765_08135 [Candidatus Peribacteria bacterium]